MTLRFAWSAAPGPPDLLDLWRAHWYGGFSEAGYLHAVRRASRSRFARHQLAIVTLRRGSELYAGAKLYDFHARIRGEAVRAAGLAAIFTHPAHRARGHASALVRELEERGRAAGARVALLCSEIGPAFYERLGYAVVPAPRSLAVRAAERATRDRWRAGSARDMAALRERYRKSIAARGIGLADEAFVALKLGVYASFHASGPGDRGHAAFQVGAGKPAPFVVTLASRIGIDVLLWGGEPEQVAARLRAMARGRSVKIGGPDARVLARYLGRGRRVAGPVLMARPLVPGVDLSDLGAEPWPIELF